MRTWLARRAIVALAVVAMFTLGGSVALAAIPSSGGTIHACYSRTTGAMRVVDYPTVKCRSSERLLEWAQIGPQAPPLASIGIYTAILDPTLDYREAGSGGRVLSLFVETGSTNTACLATLNEIWTDAGVVAPSATLQSLWCAARSPTIDGVVMHGVMLHVFFDGDVGVDLNLQVNVYQEGARHYRAPVPCAQVNCGG